MSNEKHSRSALKSFIWRIMGVLVLATVTYIVTGNWIHTGIITCVHHFSFLWIYYFHERFWNWIGDGITGKKRYIFRMCLYEIILGHVVLGTITLLVTGSWLAVSLVTPIYIFNKMWMYIIYDKVWEKVNWGLNSA